MVATEVIIAEAKSATADRYFAVDSKGTPDPISARVLRS